MEKWLITKILDSENNVFSKRKRRDENVVIKEDFCGACLALPLAFAGAGTATATSGDTSENNQNHLFSFGVLLFQL